MDVKIMHINWGYKLNLYLIIKKLNINKIRNFESSSGRVRVSEVDLKSFQATLYNAFT